MRTVRKLLYRDIAASVAFVAVAFLALFFFIDLVDKLDGVGRRGRTVGTAVLAAVLELPGRGYELMPIAVLIGSIFALARMAQTSEFTILRTGGLGPWRALGLLALPGVVFAVLTFAIGDVLVPASQRQAVLLAAGPDGLVQASRVGAWLKERRAATPQASPGDPGDAAAGEGEASVSVNVAAMAADGTLERVWIFEFDAGGHLSRRLAADRAQVRDGHWHLNGVSELRWPQAVADDTLRPQAVSAQLDTLDWPTQLDRGVVAAAMLPDETMTTLALWRYTRHLTAQDQAAQRQEMLFWRRAFYPLACIVMMALALPFAYMHARSGGVSLRVFGGILLGIAFVLLNNVSGHLGLLGDLTPWLVSAAPSLLFLLLSLGAFAWLVRYR